MTAWSRILVLSAGLFGTTGVGLAAWAAHRGGGESLTLAANFLLFHAPALLAVGLLGATWPLRAAASLIGVGTFLFSGDLALRAISATVLWHSAAPTGGVLIMVGWMGVGIAGAIRGQSAAS